MMSFPSPTLSSERTMQSILVTGGAGFIGSAFIRYVLGTLNAPLRVINLDALTYAGNLENLISVASHPAYIFVHGDIRAQENIVKILQQYDVDTIVHFAAESHVDRSIKGPRTFMETNVMGTLSLLEAVREVEATTSRRIHFHHISTDEVFGSLHETGFFTEETPYDPRSPYSASKAASDHLVRAYAHTYGISTTITNCSNNYGPYHFPEKLIPLMITKCLEGQPLPIYGDGLQVRDWLYVDDHAQAIWQVLRQAAPGTTWNIGGKNEWKNLDLVHTLIDVVASEAKRDVSIMRKQITFVPDRPGHDRRYAIDPSLIEKHLGWSPQHDFPTGLRQTVRWYLDNPTWIANVKSGAYKDWLKTQYGG